MDTTSWSIIIAILFVWWLFTVGVTTGVFRIKHHAHRRAHRH